MEEEQEKLENEGQLDRASFPISQVLPIVHAHFGGNVNILDLKNINNEGKGRMNTLLKVTLDSPPEKVIIRVRTHPHYLYDQDAINESHLYPLLSEKGINTPALYAADASRELVPYVYTITECLEGDEYTPNNLTPEIVKIMGKTLGQIHSITFSKYGQIHDVFQGSGISSWQEMFNQKIEAMLSNMQSVDTSLYNSLDKFFTREIPLTVPAEPTLVHFDYHLENLIFKAEMVYVLDWDGSYIGGPEKDFANVKHWVTKEDEDLFSQFLNSYKEVKEIGSMDDFAQRYKVEEALWLARMYIFELLDENRSQNVHHFLHPSYYHDALEKRLAAP